MSDAQFLILIGCVLCVAAEACRHEGRQVATSLLATALVVAGGIVWWLT